MRFISAKKAQRIRKHYRLVAFWSVRLSDAEAVNYGIVHIFMLALVAITLYLSTTANEVQAGDIFAIISYTWNFIEGLDAAPLLVQQASRVRDIGQRVGAPPTADDAT